MERESVNDDNKTDSQRSSQSSETSEECIVNVRDINQEQADIVAAAMAINTLQPQLTEEEVIKEIEQLSKNNSPEASQALIDRLTPHSTPIGSQNSQNSETSDIGNVEIPQFSFNDDILPLFNNILNRLQSTLTKETIRSVLQSFRNSIGSISIPAGIYLIDRASSASSAASSAASAAPSADSSSLFSGMSLPDIPDIPSVGDIVSLIDPTSCLYEFINNNRVLSSTIITFVIYAIYVLGDQERTYDTITQIGNLYNIKDEILTTIKIAVSNIKTNREAAIIRREELANALQQRRQQNLDHEHQKLITGITGDQPPLTIEHAKRDLQTLEQQLEAINTGAGGINTVEVTKLKEKIDSIKKYIEENDRENYKKRQRQRGGKGTKRKRRTKKNKKTTKKTTKRRTYKRKHTKRRTNRARK